MGLHQLLAALRDDLRRRCHATTFFARARFAPALAEHPGIESVLEVLDDTEPTTFAAREGILRALLLAHRASEGAEPTWAGILLVAFAPMLSALRRRLRGDAFTADELDGLVLEGFIDALERCPADARVVSRRLHLDTQRFVMRALVSEQRRIVEQWRLEDRARAEEGFVAFEWRTTPAELDDEERAELEELLRTLVADAVAEPRLELVIATRIWDRPLSDVVPANAASPARDYQRLKRERSRTLAQLRALFNERLSPTAGAPALDLSTLRAAS